MRNLSRHIIFVATVFVVSFLLSCNDDSTERAYAEQTAFAAYMASENIAEDDYTVINGVYRVVEKTYYDSGDWTRPEDYSGDFPPQVVNGDEISFFFMIQQFNVSLSTSTGTIGDLIYTNSQSVIDEINSQEDSDLNGFYPYLNPANWPTDPLMATIGEDGGILQGITEALTECRLGDHIWALIPSRLAYGELQTGYFTNNTALYAEIIVTDLNGITSRTQP